MSTAEDLIHAATRATIPERLRHWARERPDRLFLWCGDDQMTFREADARSDRVAAGLAELGLIGEHVAIITPNRPEMVELYLGAAKAGAVQVPLNVFLKGNFLRDQLIDSAANTLVADHDGCKTVAPLLAEVGRIQRVIALDDTTDVPFPDHIEVIPYQRLRTSTEPVPEIRATPDTPMSVLYTSGTTGPPKGCVLTHGYDMRLAAIADAVAEFGEDDVILTALPLFHGAARTTCVGAALRRGLTAVVEPEFRSTMLERAAETGATVIFGVASMGQVLLAQQPSAGDRDHRVRLAVWGPADAEAETRIRDRFGFEVLSRVYGQTECGYSTFDTRAHPALDGSSGRAAPDLEMELVDEDENTVPIGEVGEIVFRPRHRNAMFRGYWNKPETTLETFRGLWYHTGDFGRMSADGSLFFVDRKKDYLRRRGENVSSLELEGAIRAYPKVSDAAVHDIPSEVGEDDIKACVVAVDGASIDPHELFDFFVDTIPYFAIPRYVELMTELPKNAVGRVTKNDLRDRGVTDTTWDFEQLELTVAASDRR